MLSIYSVDTPTLANELHLSRIYRPNLHASLILQIWSGLFSGIDFLPFVYSDSGYPASE